MKALWNNTIIAESDDTIEIEGNQYFPIDSVNKDFLTESEYKTVCPWKGDASYYNISVNGEVNKNAAWYYAIPKDGSIEKVGSDFTNYVSFWNGVIVE